MNEMEWDWKKFNGIERNWLNKIEWNLMKLNEIE